jgi:hypothetical protein
VIDKFDIPKDAPEPIIYSFDMDDFAFEMYGKDGTIETDYHRAVYNLSWIEVTNVFFPFKKLEKIVVYHIVRSSQRPWQCHRYVKRPNTHKYNLTKEYEWIPDGEPELITFETFLKKFPLYAEKY